MADAAALVDLLLGNELGDAVQRRISGHVLHAPAHVDAELLSALGRLQRAGTIEADDVDSMLHELVAAPILRHPVGDLVVGAWSRRHQLRLADALYVELAALADWHSSPPTDACSPCRSLTSSSGEAVRQ